MRVILYKYRITNRKDFYECSLDTIKKHLELQKEI